MKKIPTNSFEIMRIVYIIFIVIGLAPIAILLGASIAALFIDGFVTFIYALIATIMCSLLLFLFIIFPSFIMKGLCETGISFSEHISRQTKILEEINKKLDKSDNEKTQKTQENSRQTKILEETNEKLDNEETQENSRQTKILKETNEKLDNEETQE